MMMTAANAEAFCLNAASCHRYLMLQLYLFSGARGFDRRGADLEVGQTPAPRMCRWLARDGVGEFGDHQVARAFVRRQRDLLAAALGIDQEPVGRLADVAALAAHHGQTEMRLMRRAHRNG